MHCRTGQGKIASPLLSAVVLNRLTACLCHCKYTHGDLLLIQLYSDARPMHCRFGQGITASLLFSSALSTNLTAALRHFNNTYGDFLFTQVCSDA